MDFVQVLNLKKQIFAKIPKQHLLVPSGANTATLYISVEDAAIQIVGYETEESNAPQDAGVDTGDILSLDENCLMLESTCRSTVSLEAKQGSAYPY